PRDGDPSPGPRDGPGRTVPAVPRQAGRRPALRGPAPREHQLLDEWAGHGHSRRRRDASHRDAPGPRAGGALRGDDGQAEGRVEVMKRIPIQGAKLNIVFRAGELPAIDPNNPEFLLALGAVEIRGKVNAKAARKLAVHQGGAVLQGRLIVEAGKLT